MIKSNTIQQRLEVLGGEMMPYGPAEQGIEMASTFGEYEAEYAAIRRHVAILHLPHRGLLDLRGVDVKDLLHRLMTQDVNAMQGGDTRRAFQLNTKGRIVADVMIHHGDDNTWLECDRFDIAALREQIESRLFAEDVTIEDASDSRECFALHGPAALTLLNRLSEESAENVAAMPGTHHVLTLGSIKCTAYRLDDCGVLGVRLFVPRDEAVTIYDRLLDAAGYEPLEHGAERDAEYGERRRAGLRGRPIGWLAYNTARIEAGSPIFHIDFGPDSLPAEAG
ncbi:MAG: hypothetical protein MI741_22995, partial [Rhodospirillales bacterium]|nr:hypothetical protein [Rhodospirillales bacterium]